MPEVALLWDRPLLVLAELLRTGLQPRRLPLRSDRTTRLRLGHDSAALSHSVSLHHAEGRGACARRLLYGTAVQLWCGCCCCYYDAAAAVAAAVLAETMA
jgi:hypothetical protein